MMVNFAIAWVLLFGNAVICADVSVPKWRRIVSGLAALLLALMLFNDLVLA